MVGRHLKIRLFNYLRGAAKALGLVEHIHTSIYKRKLNILGTYNTGRLCL